MTIHILEIIKKVGDSLNLGKGLKPLSLVSANPLVERVRTINEMTIIEEVEDKVLSPSRKQPPSPGEKEGVYCRNNPGSNIS